MIQMEHKMYKYVEKFGAVKVLMHTTVESLIVNAMMTQMKIVDGQNNMLSKRVIIVTLLMIESIWVSAQIDSSFIDGMPTYYIDAADGNKKKTHPKDFFHKSTPHKHSTAEQTFYQIYFVDTTLFPHVNEEIIVYSVERKKSKTYYTDSTGKIELMLPKGIWEFTAKKLGVSKKLRSIARGWGKKTELKDMRTIYFYNWEEQVKLNILFEPSKSIIQKQSFHALDELYEYLNRKKEEKIEIIGHTDNTGNATSNLQLSKARAEAIKQYLVDKGITADRLTTNGMGDTQPIADNSTEKGRAKNRRTEIRVVP